MTRWCGWMLLVGCAAADLDEDGFAAEEDGSVDGNGTTELVYEVHLGPT